MSFQNGEFHEESFHGNEYLQDAPEDFSQMQEEFICMEECEAYGEQFIHEDEFNQDFECGLKETDAEEAAELTEEEHGTAAGRKKRRLPLQKMKKVLRIGAAAAAAAVAAAPLGILGAGFAGAVQTALHQDLDIHNAAAEWTVSERATCHNCGIQVLLCRDCGTALAERETEQLMHAPGAWMVLEEPDCIHEGREQQLCTMCLEQLAVRSIPAADHRAGDWLVDRQATCYESGERHTECIFCGCVLAQETVTAAHTERVVAAVPATCVADGLTEGIVCSVCDTVLKEQSVLTATGHTVVTDAAVAASCYNTGLTEGSHCSVCGAVLQAQTVIPFAHRPETIAAVEADCWNTGLTQGSYCSLCQTVLIEQQVTPIKHSNIIVRPYEAPTCDMFGSTEGQFCGICQAMIVEPVQIPPVGHNWVRDESVATHESYICTYCQATTTTPY